jgi:hypothetical protein
VALNVGVNWFMSCVILIIHYYNIIEKDRNDERIDLQRYRKINGKFKAIHTYMIMVMKQ